jgi:hypothetical protein
MSDDVTMTYLLLVNAACPWMNRSGRFCHWPGGKSTRDPNYSGLILDRLLLSRYSRRRCGLGRICSRIWSKWFVPVMTTCWCDKTSIIPSLKPTAHLVVSASSASIKLPSLSWTPIVVFHTAPAFGNDRLYIAEPSKSTPHTSTPTSFLFYEEREATARCRMSRFLL